MHQEQKQTEVLTSSLKMASRRNRFIKSKKNKVVNTNDNDIGLKKTRNPWKPTRLRLPYEADEHEVDYFEKLHGKVLSILNKLTPNNLEVLVEQFKRLEIDNEPKLNTIIKLIFERAINEPIFSETYARFCTQLKVHESFQDSDPGSEHASIRRLIINRCQCMYEDLICEDNDVMKLEKEIIECKDPDKKKLLEEEKRQRRIRSVNLMKFIGEIFKLGGLVKLMLLCVDTLLTDLNELKLECLCKLITTAGEYIEVQHDQSLSEYFEKIKKIVAEGSHGMSNRIRFMLMDLIDLRERNWAVRLEQNVPKTIDELELEFSRSLALVDKKKVNRKRKVKIPDQKLVGIVTNDLDKGCLMMTSTGQNMNRSQSLNNCFKHIQKTFKNYGMTDNMRFLMIDSVPEPLNVIELDSILNYYPSECPLKNQVRFSCKKVYEQLIKLMRGTKRDLKHLGPSRSNITTWAMVNIGDELQTPIFAQIFLLALFESCSEVNENNIKVVEDTFAKMLDACQQAVNKDEASQKRCRDAVREYLFDDPKTTKDLFYRIYCELQEGASWDEVAKSLHDVLQQ